MSPPCKQLLMGVGVVRGSSSSSSAPSILPYEQRLIAVVLRHCLGPVLRCGVVSDEVAGLGGFHVLTSWVLCYLGLLVPPWGL